LAPDDCSKVSKLAQGYDVADEDREDVPHHDSHDRGVPGNPHIQQADVGVEIGRTKEVPAKTERV
jgi:hypothetical protein